MAISSDRFIEQVPNFFSWISCNQIPYPLIYCKSCHAIICSPCAGVQQYGIQNEIEINCPRCDIQHTTGIVDNNLAKMYIESLVQKCGNESYGCTFWGTQAQMEQHQLNCEYDFIQCQYCGQQIKRTAAQEHKCIPKMAQFISAAQIQEKELKSKYENLRDNTLKQLQNEYIVKLAQSNNLKWEIEEMKRKLAPKPPQISTPTALEQKKSIENYGIRHPPGNLPPRIQSSQISQSEVRTSQTPYQAPIMPSQYIQMPQNQYVRPAQQAVPIAIPQPTAVVQQAPVRIPPPNSIVVPVQPLERPSPPVVSSPLIQQGVHHPAQPQMQEQIWAKQPAQPAYMSRPSSIPNPVQHSAKSEANRSPLPPPGQFTPSPNPPSPPQNMNQTPIYAQPSQQIPQNVVGANVGFPINPLIPGASPMPPSSAVPNYNIQYHISSLDSSQQSVNQQVLPDWKCQYCKTLNNTKTCYQCGYSNRSEQYCVGCQKLKDKTYKMWIMCKDIAGHKNDEQCQKWGNSLNLFCTECRDIFCQYSDL